MWLLRLKNTQWMLIKNVFHPNLLNMCDNPPELWLFGYKECAPPVFTQCAITWMLIVGVDLTHSDPQQNTHRFVRKQALLLNATLYGGLLWPSHINFEDSQLQQEGLVWSNLQMNWVTWVPIINYEQDPENATKFQQNLSHAICDRMIKNNPCKVGLIWLV